MREVKHVIDCEGKTVEDVMSEFKQISDLIIENRERMRKGLPNRPFDINENKKC